MDQIFIMNIIKMINLFITGDFTQRNQKSKIDKK